VADIRGRPNTDLKTRKSTLGETNQNRSRVDTNCTNDHHIESIDLRLEHVKSERKQDSISRI